MKKIDHLIESYLRRNKGEYWKTLIRRLKIEDFGCTQSQLDKSVANVKLQLEKIEKWIDGKFYFK